MSETDYEITGAATDFCKFINEYEIEFYWHYNNETRERDVVLFPSIYHIVEMNKMLFATNFYDSGIPCRMMDGYFVFWASDILDGWGIELTDVFGDDIQ